MPVFLLGRLASSLLVVFGAATIVFLAMRSVPGDPAVVMLGVSATPEQIAALRASWGLDAPLFVQYFNYLVRMASFDFGQSLRLGISAGQAVAQNLPNTVYLAVVAFVMAVSVGLPLGVYSALRRGRAADRLVSLLSLAGQSLPSFWVGIMLVLVFSRALHILPSGGAESPQAVLLPAITLALPLLSVIVRLVRSGLLEAMGEPYMQTARAKGLGEPRVIGVHGVRNMLIPVVTVVGLELGTLLGGAVIVETVFAWPGLGRLLIDSIAARDYAVVQASVVMLVVFFVAINIVVDMLYGVLDPRVRVNG